MRIRSRKKITILGVYDSSLHAMPHLCTQILITEKIHKDTAREDLKITTKESLEMSKKRNMVCQIYTSNCEPWSSKLYII